MKYWQQARGYPWDSLDGPGIVLHDQDDSYAVISISKRGDMIRFYEECDGYYCVELSPDDAVRVLEEAIEYIKGV